MIKSSYYIKRGIIFLYVFTLYCTGGAQDVMIKSVSKKGNDVIINYDLEDENLNHKYTLKLYSSEDNYVQPLEHVDGDIGLEQSVGGNKQIVWHTKQELGEGFKGDVSLELKGKLYIPFVTLNNFEDMSSMKRDRPYNMTWVAGRGSNVLTFDLFNKKKKIVHTYTNIANVGEYKLQIPKDVKPGNNYQFRITDQRNKEDVVYTPPFRVKRKIPLAVKVAVVAIVGGSIYALINNQSSSNNGSGGEVPLLPDPITPF